MSAAQLSRTATALCSALLVAALAMIVVAPAGAATATRCDQLRGKTKIKTAKIKVVEIRARDRRLHGKRAYGCVLPRGKVFRVAQEGVPQSGPLAGNVNQINYRLIRFAGRFLAVERSQGDGIALTGSEQWAVMDLASGTNRRFYRGSFGEYACDPGPVSRTPPVQRIVLSAGGTFAVHYARAADATDECYPMNGQALLRGFPRTGSPQQLDLAPVGDLPPAAVAVSGSTVTWMNAGELRSKTL